MNINYAAAALTQYSGHFLRVSANFPAFPQRVGELQAISSWQNTRCIRRLVISDGRSVHRRLSLTRGIRTPLTPSA